MQVGDRVRILSPESINYLNTGTVTAVSGTGRIQVEADNGDLDLFLPRDLTPFRGQDLKEAAAAIRKAEKELSKARYQHPVREEGSPGMCAGCSTPITVYGPETKKGNGKWLIRCPECEARPRWKPAKR